LFLAGSNVILAAQSDEDFIKTAIGINLGEIQMGQLAQKNGSTAGVREFGAMLVRDHTASNQDAVALAKKHNVTAPNAPSDEDQKMYQDLTGKREAEFNKTFAQDMVDGHQKAVKLFTDESSSASGDIKSFADKTIPKLKQHLATAQKLLKNPDVTATNENQVAATNNPDNPSNMQLVEPSKISVEDLKSASVYDTTNRNIGSVSDLILTKDGKIDAVVLDVGGFLGLNTKAVALAFENLQYRRDNRKNFYVYSKFTKEQLEKAPTYDKNAYEAQRDSMRLHSTASQ